MILKILYLFAFILCVLGLTELVFLTKIVIVSPKRNANKYLTVFLTKDDFLLQLAGAYERLNWYGSSAYNGIIALTDELSFEDIELCRQVYSRKPGVRLYFCGVCETETLLRSIKIQDE